MTLLTVILIAGCITVAIATVIELYVALVNAPEGYEDSTGFNRGKPGPDSDWRDYD